MIPTTPSTSALSPPSGRPGRARLALALLAIATLPAFNGCGCCRDNNDQGAYVTIEAVHTDAAPAAIGPYSQAVAAGGIVFCSGQIALHPETGEMIGETAAEQAVQVMQNLAAVLEAAGSGTDRVVRTTIFLADMADFAAVNEVYARSFPALKPARATVAVKTLPKNARVEIDCIAMR